MKIIIPITRDRTITGRVMIRMIDPACILEALKYSADVACLGCCVDNSIPLVQKKV